MTEIKSNADMKFVTENCSLRLRIAELEAPKNDASYYLRLTLSDLNAAHSALEETRDGINRRMDSIQEHIQAVRDSITALNP